MKQAQIKKIAQAIALKLESDYISPDDTGLAQDVIEEVLTDQLDIYG